MPFTREDKEEYWEERKKKKRGYTKEETAFFAWLADEYGLLKAWTIELQYPPWTLGGPSGIQESDYWRYWLDIGKPKAKGVKKVPLTVHLGPEDLPPMTVYTPEEYEEAQRKAEKLTDEGWEAFLRRLAAEGQEVIPNQLVLLDGEYYRPHGTPVPSGTAQAEHNAYLESLKIEPEDEEDWREEAERKRLEEEKRQAKISERQWYTQFFESQQQEQYRRQQEEALTEERGRERMTGERQSIMQLALEREQILAELKAHPRNWIEAAMFQMGSKPFARPGISPQWGAAPTRTAGAMPTEVR